MREVLHSDRPWGAFDQYTHNEATTIKIIRVASRCKLSLQRHNQREELWVALDDGLTVEVDGRTWAIEAGDRAEVPKGAMHRMSNDSDSDARVMEISFGRFDEDDIQRFEDDYGRG